MRKTWIAVAAALVVLLFGLSAPSTGRQVPLRPRTTEAVQTLPQVRRPAVRLETPIPPGSWPDEKPWMPTPPVVKRPEWEERLCPDVTRKIDAGVEPSSGLRGEAVEEGWRRELEWGFNYRPGPEQTIVFKVRVCASATDEDRARIVTCVGTTDLGPEFGVPKMDPKSREFWIGMTQGADLRAVLESVLNEPVVEWLVLDVAEKCPLDEYPDDPEFPLNSAFDNTGQTGGLPGADIDAPEAWDIWDAPFLREVVAVIDTGVDPSNREVGFPWLNRGEISGLPGLDDDGNSYTDDIRGWDFLDNDNDPSDVEGHGTAVSGVVGAAAYNGFGTAGLCREIVLLPIRARSSERRAHYRDIALAIDYAVEGGADVINLSWSLSQCDPYMSAAVRRANAAGVLVVCTAGNFPVDVDRTTSFPATLGLPNVVVVTGTDQWDRFIPSFGYGAERVLLAAPGHKVLTTMRGNKIEHVSGTSFAAPQVAAAAALAIGYWKFMNHTDVRPPIDVLVSALTQGVDRLPTLEGKCKTGGRLNVAKVLGAIYGQGRHSMAGWTYRGGRYLSGVQVTLSGRRTTASDQFGSWAFHSLPDGTYTVTPSRRGFVFSPPSQDVTIQGRDERVPNFSATPIAPRAVFGIVRNGDQPVVGATVTLSGEVSDTKETDVEGGFQFGALVDGEYQVSVRRAGMAFVPETASLTIDGGDVGIRFDVAPGGGATKRSVSEVFREEGLAIRDGESLESVIVVEETEPADAVDVYVEILHPIRNDLSVIVVAPDGEEVILSWADGGPPDLVGWFGRDLEATGPIWKLAGRPTGTWKLRVRDIAPGDEGTLVRWGLAFVRSTPRRNARLVLGCGAGGEGWIETLGADLRRATWTRHEQGGYTLGETRPACGDVDGDGLDEMVIGVGRGGAGWVAVRDDEAHGRALLAWLRVPDEAYCAANGETRPALGDIDGDGRAELVVGLGAGGGGRVAWFDDAQAQFASRGFASIGFSAYDAAVGETRPACGDLDGDGRAEVVVGLAPFPSNGGLVAVLSLAFGDRWRARWARVPWQAYNARNGETWPACGDVEFDGRDEVVLGLGANPGQGGWAIVLDDAATNLRPMRWVAIPWPAYRAAGGPVHPAFGDVDGDRRDELALGTGPFPRSGGCVAILDDADHSFALRGWARLHWPAYNAASGETWPAFTR